MSELRNCMDSPWFTESNYASHPSNKIFCLLPTEIKVIHKCSTELGYLYPWGTIRFQIPTKARCSSLQTGSWAHPTSYSSTNFLFREQSGSKSLTTTEVTNEWSYTSTPPHAFGRWRDKLYSFFSFKFLPQKQLTVQTIQTSNNHLYTQRNNTDSGHFCAA